jgi:hypothetical protein
LANKERTDRDDYVAGHVRFELRNVDANYLFERSHRFPRSAPNFGHGDHSPLSCGAGHTQLGAGFAGIQQARCADVGHRSASPRRPELALRCGRPGSSKYSGPCHRPFRDVIRPSMRDQSTSGLRDGRRTPPAEEGPGRRGSRGALKLQLHQLPNCNLNCSPPIGPLQLRLQN